MSLTAKGYRERMWGSFPVLRQALEDKGITSQDYDYGLTSADDNMVEAMNRLILISMLAVEHERYVKETAQLVGQEEIYKDLKLLEEALQQASHFFERQIKEVRKLYGTL